MGLFEKKKSAPAAEPAVQVSTEVETVWTNLTEKMLRVELDEDSAYLTRVEVKEAGDHLRLVSGGVILAEVGKRGKAYKELEPYVGKTAASISLKLKTGEYGDYYSAGLKFETNVSTITF